MRITSQVPTKDQPSPHSHKLHIDTVCLCCNVLDPCHGFTFSFTFPLSTTTQLFFRCYAALRQAQGKHRNRQFGAHARGSMARSLPSQSFTSLPLLLEYSLPYWACPYCGLYPSSTYKTNRALAIYCFKLYSVVNWPIGQTRKPLVFPVCLLHRTSIHDPTSITIDAGLAHTKGGSALPVSTWTQDKFLLALFALHVFRAGR